MRTYHVYQHPALGYKAVKHGFNWPAFLFLMGWSAVKKLWLISAVLLGAFVLILDMQLFFMNSSSNFGIITMLIFLLLLSVFAGKQGNLWTCNHLKSRGFKKLRTVKAINSDTAISAAVDIISKKDYPILNNVLNK